MPELHYRKLQNSPSKLGSLELNRNGKPKKCKSNVEVILAWYKTDGIIIATKSAREFFERLIRFINKHRFISDKQFYTMLFFYEQHSMVNKKPGGINHRVLIKT